ncbi:MAG: hypothetical protein ACREKE_03645 [bacterium]
MASGKPARALDVLRESVRLEPGAAGYAALGRAFEALGLQFKAAWAYRHSLHYAPDPALSVRLQALKDGKAEELRQARLRSTPSPKSK